MSKPSDRVIYKYPLRLSSPTSMHAGAEILTVQVQRSEACVWARVLPDAPIVSRDLVSFGTGHAMPSEADSAPYIGSYQLLDGDLVFHLFDFGEVTLAAEPSK